MINLLVLLKILAGLVLMMLIMIAVVGVLMIGFATIEVIISLFRNNIDNSDKS